MSNQGATPPQVKDPNPPTGLLSYEELIALPLEEFAKAIHEDDPEVVRQGIEEAGGIEKYLEERAYDALDGALMFMELSAGAIAATILAVGIKEVTTEIPTFAVTIRGDGIERLWMNPAFSAQLSHRERRFVLAHEAYHLLLRHLYRNKELAADRYWTIATECVINHLVKKHISASEVPAGGVDPEQVYDGYKKAAKKMGMDAVDFETFIKSDASVYALLRQTQPPLKNVQITCHTSCGEGSDDGDQQQQQGSGGGLGSDIDPESLGDIIEGALDNALDRAKQGSEDLKNVLLDLMDATPELSDTWGNLGLGALRGKTESSRAHVLWQQLFARALTSKLAEEGERPIYDRKTGWWDTGIPGVSRPLAPMGKDEQSQVLIAIDTSGSMPDQVIYAIAATVGKIPNVHATWVTFDADVYEFQPGDPLKGGGGTSFDPVVKYMMELEEVPDAVVAVTDGYAPPINPPYPERWIWLITPNGDQWPAKQDPPMVTIEFDPTKL